MTSAVAVEGRGFQPVNAGLAATAVATAILLVAVQEPFRRAEAATCAMLVSLLRIAPAESTGTVVVFPAKGRYVGFSVTPSCTAVLLIVPFVLVTGLLLLVGRVDRRHGLATVATFAAAMLVVNELRLLVITVSMRAWGYPQGFERSHVLLGTLVSTVGVAGGLLLFLRMVVPRRGTSPRA